MTIGIRPPAVRNPGPATPSRTGSGESGLAGLKISRRRSSALVIIAAAVLAGAVFAILVTTRALPGGRPETAVSAGSSDAGRLLLALAVCITVALGGGILGRRLLGQPEPVGQMVTGLVLGPSMLGALFPGVLDWLFTAPVSSQLDGLAQLGIALFVFFLARELSHQDLRGASVAILGFAVTAMAVPFLLGVLLARHLFDRFAPAGASPVAFALLIGMVCGATAVPVLGASLDLLGMSGRRIGVIALTSAVVADALAWCGMAAAVAAQAGSGHTVLVFAGELAVFVVAVVVCSRLAAAIARRRFHRAPGPDDNPGPDTGDPAAHTAGLAATVVLVTVGAACTSFIGIHAVVGAFIAGICGIAGRGPYSVAEQRLREVNQVLLLPLFFVTVGLRLDFGALLRAGSIVQDIGLALALACGGKLLGAVLPARVLGLPWSEGIQLGLLLNCRGVTDLVILDLGRHLGLVGPELYTCLALIILITTVTTTPLVRRMQRRTAISAP